MAKKENTPKDKKKEEKKENTLLIETFSEFKETKNIDRATLVSVLEESFRSVIAKMVGSDENYDVIVNPDKGTCEIYRNLKVVEDGKVEDENLQISLSEARKTESDFVVGDDVVQIVDFAKFGRRAILNLRQTLASKVLELEHDALYNKYVSCVGDIISAEVYQVWHKEVLLLDEDGNELILPRSEQIPGDYFRKGEPARAVVARVDNATGNPKIILSRTSPVFLQRLLEHEVPEIGEGVIAVRKIARIPGERAKIAVESFDERIDPVGACVGVRGSRVQGIVRELHGENLDVIPWTNNLQLLITRALQPATINSIHFDEEQEHCEVYLDPDQVSLAIGKNGYNIRLATMLTNVEIDVFRELPAGVEEENDDDIRLDAFKDEIDEWIIDELKKCGWETARALLEAPRDMIVKKSDLEEETVDDVLRLLRQEFADDENETAEEDEETTPKESAAPETTIQQEEEANAPEEI